MYYDLLKHILFQLDPETAHHYTLRGLRLLHALGVNQLYPKISAEPRTVMNLDFPNIVGLAAGLDKNADYLDALAALGFGFIEVGTVTPQPQVGNNLPRVFRLPQQEAIINRLGFNNKGIDYLIEKVKQAEYKGILGINIGKNRTTPLEQATEDYLHGLRRVAPHASYVTINISSPNTEGLRQLQHKEMLQDLLKALKQEQHIYFELKHKYVPLVVKIAPDLTDQELAQMAEIFLAEKIDGVIATNTTLSREGVESSAHAQEVGGLSGKPLSERSTAIIKKLKAILQDEIPIIASGGVMSRQDALDKLEAGASLLQLYSGLIYHGPGLIKELTYC